jgi:hypothetical protein
MNWGSLYVSSITCSSSGGAAQTTLGILRACYVSWLLPGLEFHSDPGSSSSSDSLKFVEYYCNYRARVAPAMTVYLLTVRLIHCSVDVKVKVKQSIYRPWQALRVPGGWGSQILRQSAHEGGKVVSPTRRSPLSPGNIPGSHFCWGWVDPRTIVRPDYVNEKFQWYHRESIPRPSSL